MNWQDQLKAFLNANPDLPEGEEPAAEPVDTDAETHGSQGRLDVRMERKGRAGKTATIISGWTVDDDALQSIASRIKQRLGCGGSASEGEIMLQGDRRDQAVSLLQSLGYKARRTN